MSKEPADKKQESMKHVEWWFLFSIFVIIVVTVFALTNAAPAPVRFFFWTVELSLALLIFLSAAVGAVIAISLGFMKQLRNRKHYKLQEKQLAELNRENAALRAQIVEMEGKLKESRTQTTAAGNDSKPTDHDSDPEDSGHSRSDDMPGFLRTKSSD